MTLAACVRARALLAGLSALRHTLPARVPRSVIRMPRPLSEEGYRVPVCFRMLPSSLAKVDARAERWGVKRTRWLLLAVSFALEGMPRSWRIGQPMPSTGCDRCPHCRAGSGDLRAERYIDPA